MSTNIDNEFDKLDHLVEDTQSYREELFNNVIDGIRNMSLDMGGDSARTSEVKMQLIKLGNELLGSKEDAALKTLKLKLSNKNIDVMDAKGDIVAEILRSIRPNDPVSPATDDITKREIGEFELNEDEIPITEGELEMSDINLSDQ